MRSSLRAAALALLACARCAPRPPRRPPSLDPVASFAAPTFVTSPPGDPRLFVTERAGVGADRRQGRRRQAGAVPRHLEPYDDRRRARPALDRVPARLHRQRARVRLRDGPSTGRCRSASSAARASDPDRAEPGAGRLVLSQAALAVHSNHNGGQVQFGSDGLLYAGFGDGGAGNDPSLNGQNLDTLLGKVIRLDVNGDAFPGDPAKNYAIPASNPFVLSIATASTRSGPWVCATPTGSPSTARPATCGSATSGRTRARRSTAPRRASAARTTAGAATRGRSRRPRSTRRATPPGHVPPLFDLDQAADGVCSITGGYVVRDPGLPTLAGRYLYGDLCRHGDPVRRPRTGEPGTGDRPVRSTRPRVVRARTPAAGSTRSRCSGPVSRIRDGAGTSLRPARADRAVRPRRHPRAPPPRGRHGDRHRRRVRRCRRRPHRAPPQRAPERPPAGPGRSRGDASPCAVSEPATVRAVAARARAWARCAPPRAPWRAGVPARLPHLHARCAAASASAGPSRAAHAWRRSR